MTEGPHARAGGERRGFVPCGRGPRRAAAGVPAPQSGIAARRARRRERETGIALIMVMGAITVLAVMLADFQDDASAEHASATADRDSVQAEYFARSAVNLSRLLIATEPTIRASVAPLFMLMRRTPPQLPVWNFADRLLGAFNDQESASGFARTTGIDLALGKNLGMPGGRFEVTIVDEDAKINVNQGGANEVMHIRLAKELMGLLIPPQYSPLFEQKDATGNFHDRLTICSHLIDWADMDERSFNCDQSALTASSSSGAEGGWYQQLQKPYRAKNAPYDSLEELRMVRGVGDDFWATFVDPSPEQPEKRALTVWGQSAVNVNSANAQTLLGLICAGAPTAEICNNLEQAQKFLMGVTMAKGMTMGAPLFGNKDDFIKAMKGEGTIGPMLTTFLGMKPVKFQSEGDFKSFISTESKIFSIYAVGVVKGYKRETRTRVHAVVDFRAAPSLQQLADSMAKMAVGAAGGTVPGGPAGAQPGQAPTTQQGNEYANVTRPSTGGSVLYYRIE